MASKLTLDLSPFMDWMRARLVIRKNFDTIQTILNQKVLVDPPGEFPVLSKDPASPLANTFWVTQTGSHPTTVALRAYVLGQIVTVASVDIP